MDGHMGIPQCMVVCMHCLWDYDYSNDRSIIQRPMMIRWLKNLFRGGLAYGPVIAMPKSTWREDQLQSKDNPPMHSNNVVVKIDGVIIARHVGDDWIECSNGRGFWSCRWEKVKDPAQPSPPGVSN